MSYISSSGGGGGGGDVMTLTGNTGGPISPTAGNINIVGAGAITVSGVGSTLTISNGAASFMWNVVTSGATMAVNNGYFANNGSNIVLTLPLTAAIGDTITVTNMNTALGWTIAQNNSQSIRLGIATTTIGTGGSLASTAVGDSITFVCSVAGTSTRWIATSVIGNITIV